MGRGRRAKGGLIMGRKGIKHVDLIPCPYCGSWASISQFEKGLGGNYYIQCQNPDCGIMTPFGTKREVVDIWQRRAEVVQ